MASGGTRPPAGALPAAGTGVGELGQAAELVHVRPPAHGAPNIQPGPTHHTGATGAQGTQPTPAAPQVSQPPCAGISQFSSDGGASAWVAAAGACRALAVASIASHSDQLRPAEASASPAALR